MTCFHIAVIRVFFLAIVNFIKNKKNKIQKKKKRQSEETGEKIPNKKKVKRPGRTSKPKPFQT